MSSYVFHDNDWPELEMLTITAVPNRLPTGKNKVPTVDAQTYNPRP
ncbi:MAG TPA: hypothetical protein VKX33_02380 [Cyclobacteriaceae bacterium]|nr:hypothetical protein [Cyclobacteriaceae bacterium]